MKTAMQELIDYLLKWDKEGDENFDALLCGTLVKATLALGKEKEQICNAYTDGLEGPYIGAEEYYNQTFNQNK